MRAWLALPFVLGACGGSAESVSGMPGMTVPAQFAGNVAVVPVTLGGSTGGHAVLDTGSPFTILDPGAFPGASSSAGARVRTTLGLGALTIADAYVYETVGSTTEADGLIGVDDLGLTSIAFDRRDATVRFGAGADPDDIASATLLPFTLAGGGETNLGGNIHYPATRILVTTTVEGATHTFLLDTGASDVVLRSSLMTQLTADGRPQIMGPIVTTLAAQVPSSVSRVRALTVAGQEVDNLIALSIGDDLLDTVSTEVGQTLDGILGGNFNREFFLTVDYPRGELTLQKWNDRSFIVDEFQRIGVELGANPTGTIAFVYAGSDAEKQGLVAGDVVLSIDGKSLEGLDPLLADDMMAAPVGSSHTLLVDTASAPNEPMSVTVVSEDLVPMP